MATLTQADLVEALRQQGFPIRLSKLLTKTILSVMIDALKSCQTVELPFGTLKVKVNRAPVRTFAFGTIVERYRKNHRVVFVPRRDGEGSDG